MVHVDHQQRQRRTLAQRLAPGARHGLVQRQAVGHLGERVHAHLRLQRVAVTREFVLGVLAVGDVLHGAGHQQRLAVAGGVAVLAPHLDPAHLAVAVALDAVLGAQRNALAHGTAVDLQGLRALVGVQHPHPLAQRHAPVGRQAEDGAGHARHDECLALTLVDEVAHRGRFLRVVQPAQVALQLRLQRPFAPPGPPLPQHHDAAQRQQPQADEQAQGQPFAALGSGEGVGHVHLGHQQPGRVRHRAGHRQHRLVAIVAAVEGAPHARDGQHHGITAARLRRKAQRQWFIAAMAQGAEEQGRVVLPLHQHRFGGAAAGGPGLQQWVERGARIHHQPDGPQRRGSVVQRRQQSEERKGEGRVAAQLDNAGLGPRQRALQRAHLGWLQRARGRPAGIQDQPALRIDEIGSGIAHMLDQDAQPLTHRLFGVRRRRCAPAGHRLCQKAVVGECRRLPQAPAPPVRHPPHLHVVHGLQAAFDLVAVALLTRLVDGMHPPANRRKQQGDKQTERPPRAGRRR